MDKKSQKNHILDIIPLTKIPLTRNQSFSYLHETGLPIGTLASIPLFHRKVEGIVVGSKKDFPRSGGIELRKIEKVLEENFLTENQVRLARFISDYYISPLGIVMKNFVPKRTKSKTKKESVKQSKLDANKIKLTPEQKKAVKKITHSGSRFLLASSFLLFGPSGSGKTEVYIHSILEMRKKDKTLQFLILIPEKTLTPQALERYSQYFPAEEIVIISSNISAGLFFENWKKIQKGEAKIIIATRKGAFSPFRKLGLIVVDEEQDISHKQWDMNPRYDARILAEELGRMHNCPVIFGSATPRLESYYRAEGKDLEMLKLPPFNPEIQPPDAEIVDMRREHWQKNYSCISKKLRSEIEYALRNKKQTILFINRQGMSAFSVCESCKTVLRCPKCDRALAYDNSGVYQCLHCQYKTSITPKCEKCKGIVFKNVGIGTQKVEREATNLFPWARVARVDSQAARQKGYAEKIYQEFSQRKIDILVGTQMISKGWDLPNISLVGIIDTDNMLTLPDFRANETFFQNIVQVSGRVGRPGAKFPGLVVLQTYQPENKLIKLSAGRNYGDFFKKEIQERKTLGYPPFGKIIKLVFQDYFSKKVSIETDRVYKNLSGIKNIKISEPEDAFVSNVRGRRRKQIIIRFKNPPAGEAKKLRSELKKLGSGWIVDVDPVSII